MKIKTVLPFLAAAVLAGCVSAPPPQVVAPQGESRYLIDPRIGWNGVAANGIDRQFDTAWRFFLAGDLDQAGTRLADIAGRQPGYEPATLAQAALDIQQRNFAAAHAIVDPLAAREPRYTAAGVYEAELDVAEGRLQSAYDRYRQLAAQTKLPAVSASRLADLQTQLFNQLYAAAVSAPPASAAPLLQQALTVNPAASGARLLLAQKLIAAQQFDQAKKELAPLLNSATADQPEVQEALAEIDVGHGRYQDAINRYDRLARHDPTGRYAQRLEQIKELFAEANMPPQIVAAMNAQTITRSNLAVLAYWDISSIRFAQNVPPPPIATDIPDGPGRDEMIRAIALGIFQVDPITRRVYPDDVVTGASLARVAARILSLRGASCAAPVPQTAGPDPILSACGITLPDMAAASDQPVSGQTAAALLVQVDRAISR